MKKSKRKKRNFNDKQLAQKFHAMGRAYHRFGLKLNMSMYKSLVTQVQNLWDVILLKSESNTRSHYLLKVDKHYYPIVYNKKYKTIVTFLPRAAVPNDLLYLLPKEIK